MIKIKLKPINLSKMYQGRRYNTKAYKDFTTAFLYLIPKGTPKITGDVKLVLNFYIKYSKNTDVSNLIKATEDCIVKAGLIEDDRFIYTLEANKFKSERERIEFEITPFVCLKQSKRKQN